MANLLHDLGKLTAYKLTEQQLNGPVKWGDDHNINGVSMSAQEYATQFDVVTLDTKAFFEAVLPNKVVRDAILNNVDTHLGLQAVANGIINLAVTEAESALDIVIDTRLNDDLVRIPRAAALALGMSIEERGRTIVHEGKGVEGGSKEAIPHVQV